MDIRKLCLGCMREKENGAAKCPHCGFDAATYEYNSRWLPLEHILDGKYLLGRVIGEGGFGITYAGWDLNMEVRVAIKEYFPIGLASREIRGTSQYTISSLTGEKKVSYRHGLEKFATEAKSLAKFYHLDGIVAVKDFFFENETAYMVMEYVDGITLKEYLKKKGERLSLEETLRIFQPVIRSLEIVHQEQIIHRDISPDNIMITRSGESKLIDFGAARMACNDQNHTFTIILKHGYAPPEQYQTKGKQGPWTDVYAVCASIYRSVTGQLPPNAMDRLSVDELKTFQELGCHVPERVASAILTKGMALQTQNRFQSMADLYDALYPNDVSNGQSISSDGSRRTGWIIGISAALVIGAAGLTFLGIHMSRSGSQNSASEDLLARKETDVTEEKNRTSDAELEGTETASEEKSTEKTTEKTSGKETEEAATETPEKPSESQARQTENLTNQREHQTRQTEGRTNQSESQTRQTEGRTNQSESQARQTENRTNRSENQTNRTGSQTGQNGAVTIQSGSSGRSSSTESPVTIETSGQANDSNWYYISSTYEKGIAVRKEPSADSTLLCRIPYGTMFQVTRYEKNWGYTTVDGVTGWIDTNYASQTNEANAQYPEPTDDSEIGWYVITSTYEKGIAVRGEASTEASLLCRIPYGTEFYVEETRGSWGYTTVNGKTGWIDTSYAEYLGIADLSEDNGADAESSQEGGWYVITSTYEKGIAVRQEPSADATLLTRIPYGTEFYAEEMTGTWGYTTVNGVTGWVDTSYAEREDGMISLDGSQTTQDGQNLSEDNGNSQSASGQAEEDFLTVEAPAENTDGTSEEDQASDSSAGGDSADQDLVTDVALSDQEEAVESEVQEQIPDGMQQGYWEIVQAYYEGCQAGWSIQQFADQNLNYLPGYDPDLSRNGYVLLDVDQDGSEELLIGGIGTDGYTGMLYELYTMTNGTPTRVLSSGERDRYYLCTDNTIANEGSGSAAESAWNYYSFGNGQLTLIESVFADGNKDAENPWFYTTSDPRNDYSTPISEEEANEIRDRYTYTDIPFTPLSELSD